MANKKPDPDAKIELRNVHKRFGSKVVLDGIDLTVPRGESLVVIGGSGTGKSVMIKSVLGIVKPEQGEIFVDGQDVLKMDTSDREETLRKFGRLFQALQVRFLEPCQALQARSQVLLLALT